MTRILITGASGDLGRPLSALASRRFDTISLYHQKTGIGGGTPAQADLTNRDTTIKIVTERRPDIVIHAAASDRSRNMAETNRNSAAHILEASREVGARLIALSSDMVFDGANAPYKEDDPVSPRSIYGQVKAENEKLFRSYQQCLVIRTSLIYDFATDNRQMAWLLEMIQAGKSIPLFVDEIRQPVWAWNLAEAILEIALGQMTGLLNVAGPQALNRWEYGSTLIRYAGHDPELVAHRAFAAETLPDRPRNCALDLSKASSAFRTRMLTMGEAATARNLPY